MSERYRQVPDELKAIPRWIGFRLEPGKRKDKLDKKPVSITKRMVADPHDPANWVGFATAVAALNDQALRLDGIGFVLTADDDLVGIDLDHSVEQGIIAPWAWEIVCLLSSYTETSPSGTGLHILAHGTLPPGGRKKGHIEAYSALRFFTVTGERHPDFPATIEDRGAELAMFHAEHLGAPTSNGHVPDHPASQPVMVESEILAKAMAARNGDKFKLLWTGDFASYPSQSEADLALCGLLAFWTGRDAGLMDSLFRQSGLMREKWDERHFGSGETYGAHTVATAVAACMETYTKNKNKLNEPTTEDLESDIEDPPVAQAEAAEAEAAEAEAAVPPPQAPAAHVKLPLGFVSRYVEVAMRRTDAPAEAHTLTAVTVMSALAGPTPRLNLAHLRAGLRLLMWSMNLVDSTSGRKTTVNDFGAEAIAIALGEEAILPWKGSPEAFIQLMAARDGLACVMTRDEYVGLLLGMKQGGYMAGLAQDFIRMWDGATLGMGRTAKLNKNTGQRVNDSDVIRNPFLVQLTAATRSRFVEVATIEDILDGFLARFTFTSGSAEEQRMKHKDPVIEAAWQRVLLLAKDYHDRAQHILTVEVTDEILDLEWELEKRFKAQALAQARPDVAAPAMKRLAESVFKTAALLALDDSYQGAATITPGHFEAAVALSHRWQATTLALVDDIGRTRFQADCDSVLATVRAHRKVSQGDLYHLHRRLRKKDFEEILGALEAQGLISRKEEKTGKRGWQPLIIRPTDRGSRA